MKINRRHYLPLLMLVPMMMANSPAPYVRTNEYQDFSYTFISKTPIDQYYEGQQYIEYTYEIKNNGSGYIDYAYINYGNIFSTMMSLNNDMFGRLILAPNSTSTYKFITITDIDVDNVNERIRCYAYTDFVENAFISDKKDVRVDNTDYPYNRYYIDYESDYKRDNNYLYGIIIDFTYDGVDYSIHDESWRYSENTYSVFLYQGEDLDLNKLTINKLTMTYSKRQ